jgi:hypothetical protein
MKEKDKRRVEQLLKLFRRVHNSCCDLMDDGVFENGKLDICSLDEITAILEHKLKQAETK